MNPSDPATWEVRWWLPVAALAVAAGLWLDRPDPGSPPALSAVQPSVAPPACAELEDGYARAACHAG